MQGVESKLAEYRARSRGSKVKTLLGFITKNSDPNAISTEQKSKEGEISSRTVIPSDPKILAKKEGFQTENEDTSVSTKKNSSSRYRNKSFFYSLIDGIVCYSKLTFLLILILWLLLFGLSVELEFGSVFFILSAFYGIYLNMRSGPKEDGAPSAYSVFNPDCERIDGTFTSEQFERELRYGPASVSET